MTDDRSMIDQLRREATVATHDAERARVLARRLAFRREQILRRDDDALSRHTVEVWSSRAASVSRMDLRRVVGFSLWLAADGLEETRRLLEARAGALDESAWADRHRADVLEAAASDYAERTRSVSKPSAAG